jgi:hypothetical protein
MENNEALQAVLTSHIRERTALAEYLLRREQMREEKRKIALSMTTHPVSRMIMTTSIALQKCVFT